MRRRSETAGIFASEPYICESLSPCYCPDGFLFEQGWRRNNGPMQPALPLNKCPQAAVAPAADEWKPHTG